MSTSPALALSIPAEPLVLTAARELAARLQSCQIVSRKVLNAVMSEQFGGSDADGRWSVRDAHAALELAQVIFLNETETLTCALPADQADRAFFRLEAEVPSQTSSSRRRRAWPGWRQGPAL
jgi:hypothetical protein